MPLRSYSSGGTTKIFNLNLNAGWQFASYRLHRLMIVPSFVFTFQFLADRTNGRAYATVLRLSVVCNVMYCG